MGVNKPDSTALRVALWRALHLIEDAAPHILEDTWALKLANPDSSWRERRDMHALGTRPFRASIVARSRFVEDLVVEQFRREVYQYVQLGSGLDTFAQRHQDLATKLKIFELEKSETLEFKRTRLSELGYTFSDGHKFVPTNFETETSWITALKSSGFDIQKPTVITSMGVSMYLTRAAIQSTLKQIAKFAPGSHFLMTFMLPLDLVDAEDRPGYEMSLNGAKASGTPFISFFNSSEMRELALASGFKSALSISTANLPYFTGRTDGLRASTGEEILTATI